MDLLNYIYPVSFGICLFSLALWYFFRNQRTASSLLSKSFIAFFLVYVLSLVLSPATTEYKLGILFRDLIVLGVSTQLVNVFKNNKKAFFGILVILMALFKFAYFKVMLNSYNQPTTNNTLSDNQDTSQNWASENGELLVDIADGQSINALSDFLKSHNIKAKVAFSDIGSPEMTSLDDYYVLDLPAGASISKIKQELSSTGLTDWIEFNEVIKTELTPGNDPVKINREFGLDDPDIGKLWGFDKMELDKLYKVLSSKKVKPKKEALVAILDTGVDSKHEDINANFKSINKRYDNDPQGHGTHCAGIAAAVSNNKKGIASYAPGNNFMDVTSIKVLNQWGMGTQRDIIKGILLAADRGVDVISMSLGGPSSDKSQKAYNDAVRYANKKGAIVVVAAGNESKDATGVSPANCKGVITVSAVNQKLEKAPFSNEVQNLKMGIAAPGVDIYSTFPKNQYKVFNGTSMATPYVAGLLGLMKSLNPDITSKEAHKILTATGIDTKDTKKTGKFIQPASVVEKML